MSGSTCPPSRRRLSDLGYSDSDLASVSRSSRLPLSPSILAVVSSKQVTIAHDGITTEVSTTDATVGQLLTDLNLTPSGTDQIAPLPSTVITDGLQVSIGRVTTSHVTESVAIPFATTQQNDQTLAKGRTVVVIAGVPGVQSIDYTVTSINGVVQSKVADATTVVTPPVTQVVHVGTLVTILASRPTPVSKAPVATAPVKPSTPEASPTTRPRPSRLRRPAH